MPSRSHHAVRVGTRGSRLALAQAELAIDALQRANPGIEFQSVSVRTRGDRNRSVSVSALGVGVYVKELEDALSDGRIDAAVHSLKDMTSELTPGFRLAAVLEREDPRDVLVSRGGVGLTGLGRGARVGTGSARRRALLLSVRPDIMVDPIRGNVDTRLGEIERSGGCDAVALAAAGLKRIGRQDAVSEYLDPDEFIPAVGQGAIAIEALEERGDILDLARRVDHPCTLAAVTAERAFLAAVRGGCSTPTSAHARVDAGRLCIRAFASDPDGVRILRATEEGDAGDASSLGMASARALLDAGAAELLGRLPESMDGGDE